MSKPVVNERIAERRAEVRRLRRRRRLRRTVLVSASVAVLVGALALERSSLVALASVDVEGVERLTEAEVLEAADVALGSSMLRLRRGEVRDRLVALPLVADAEVERVGSVGLVLRVQEVSPAVTLSMGETHLLVSADGLVLGPGEAPGTPRIVATGVPPAVGRDVTRLPDLAPALSVALQLPGPIITLVDEVRAHGPTDVDLLLESGVVVRWGSDTRLDEKVRALGAVIEDLEGQVVQTIDVRAPAAPTVTP